MTRVEMIQVFFNISPTAGATVTLSATHFSDVNVDD